ncbi:histidine phosphatase family protein [Massilia sp. S19_KUP03_FR1]|uniref:histidine phosphatase family protein n=1 Tax=Massilia sp. S19_KUP03_FR1 TaxID=3025503 RepID=UPI002FCD9BB0
MQRRTFLYALTLAAASAPMLAARAAADPALLAQLRRGGNVILMRHAATTPGTGDPDGFVLNQCGTQRNLSEAGRRDAVRIGAEFVRLGIPVADVLSSRWCRCLDTAQLAFGRVTPAPLLDSMFVDDAETKARKLRAAQAWLTTFKGAGNIVLVTHDVNIRALAGPYVEQGAMVVATVGDAGALRVAGVWLP